MADRGQVLRFAVGTATGPRSRTWRLWVPKGKSDVYVSGQRIGYGVKASLHEPGPARFALTAEFVRQRRFQAPPGRDPRLAVEWVRPRPWPPRQVARALRLIVPWDEVQPRAGAEPADVVWTPPPPEGTAVDFEVVYVPPGANATAEPGTDLVGRVRLDNGEQVVVISRVWPIDAAVRANVDRLRSGQVLGLTGNPLHNVGMLAFQVVPSPAADGTFVGVFLDVTRPDAPAPHAGTHPHEEVES